MTVSAQGRHRSGLARWLAQCWRDWKRSRGTGELECCRGGPAGTFTRGPELKKPELTVL
jgi:hypothetical protein